MTRKGIGGGRREEQDARAAVADSFHECSGYQVQRLSLLGPANGT